MTGSTSGIGRATAEVQDRIMGLICEVLVAIESVDGLRGWADAVVAFHQRIRDEQSFKENP